MLCSSRSVKLGYLPKHLHTTPWYFSKLKHCLFYIVSFQSALTVLFFFLTFLAPGFQFVPEIKKCYLMSTVEATEEEMALTKSVEASGILVLLECHRNTKFALMELMFNLMSNGHKTIK